MADLYFHIKPKHWHSRHFGAFFSRWSGHPSYGGNDWYKLHDEVIEKYPEANNDLNLFKEIRDGDEYGERFEKAREKQVKIDRLTEKFTSPWWYPRSWISKNKALKRKKNEKCYVSNMVTDTPFYPIDRDELEGAANPEIVDYVWERVPRLTQKLIDNLVNTFAFPNEERKTYFREWLEKHKGKKIFVVWW